MGTLPTLHKERSRKLAIGVDFDGVVHDYTKGWADGSIYGALMPGAFDALNSMMENHAVFIHTAREATSVAIWLADRGFETTTDMGMGAPQFWNYRGILLVTNRKLPAQAYLDDRGIRFTSWTQALRDMHELGIPYIKPQEEV